MIRSFEQETSRELHIAKDTLNKGEHGAFVSHLMEAFERADGENFDLLLPVVKQIIEKYKLECTCLVDEREV
jgi:hypothetical protein